MRLGILSLGVLTLAVPACRRDDVAEDSLPLGPDLEVMGSQAQSTVGAAIFGPPRNFGTRPPITWSGRNTDLLADPDQLIAAVRNAGGRVHIRFKDPSRLRVTARLSIIGDDTLATQPPISEASIRSGRELVTAFGGEIYMPFRNLPSVVARIDPASAKALLESPFVEYVLPVGSSTLAVRHGRGSHTPGPVASGQTIPYNLQQIRAPSAWDSTRGAVGHPILILDTGVYDGEDTHRDLPHWSTILDPMTCLTFLWPEETDCDDPINGHGTQVAGVAFARDNTIDVVGVVPITEFGYYKVCVPILGENGCSTDAETAALVWASENGSNDVINMSWSGSVDFPDVAEAVYQSHLSGDLLIAATGNDPSQPVGYPAKYAAVIAVSGVSPDDNTALGSTGPEVELSAPYYVKTTTIPFVPNGCSACLPKYVRDVWGTSYSAPAVAGVAALVWSLHPTWTNEQVRFHLTSHAVIDLGPVGRDPKFGFGRIDAFLAVSDPVAPPPGPLSTSIGGPLLIQPTLVCTWVASPSGGSLPYSYEWRRDGSLVGNGSQYSDGMNGAPSFVLKLTVRDGLNDSDSHQVTVVGSESAPPACLEA
ncbi:MAG TPA: S8 family serine peptidase [Gemmatimonadales bacterium]